MRLIKWIFSKFFGELKRDVKWLTFFMIWRAVTVGMLFFGGVAFLFTAIIGGIFFNVSGTTIFALFTTGLVGILAISLAFAVLLFVFWFLHENIWVVPLAIILFMVATVFSYSGQCYVVYTPSCGERICFEDPSELGKLSCPGKCRDCKQIIYYTYDTVEEGHKYHEFECGKTFDVFCPTCGAANGFVEESDFNHLRCRDCENSFNLECSCGAVDSLMPMEGTDVLYCANPNHFDVFELVCPDKYCDGVTQIKAGDDINTLACSKCSKKIVESANLKHFDKFGLEIPCELVVDEGINPLRCTSCGSINQNIEIAEEGGMDVIRSLRLRKLFIAPDSIFGKIRKLFK